jgi:hypothetical protein
MACERYKSQLIDEALASGSDAELTAHLRGCSDCRAELDLQRELQNRITGSIAAMVADEPSPALFTRVRQRVDAIDAIVAEDSARRASWIQWTITGAAAAALAGFAIFFAGRALLRQSNSGPQPVQTAAGTPTPEANTQIQTAPAPVAPALENHRNTQIKHARKRRLRPGQPVQVAAKHDQAPIAPSAANVPPSGAPGVIVPPGQREAVLRLVAAMKTGRVNVAGLLKESEQQQMAPIEIAPIKITPLEEKKTGSQSDGNHQ